MTELQRGDRVFHIGTPDEPGTVVRVDKDGEVVVAWDQQFHATETHPVELLRLLA